MSSWSAAEWTNAVAGEAGEAANVAKKIIRFRDAVGGNKPSYTVETLKKEMAQELADVIIYADLAIQSLGRDTEEEVANAFNNKSAEFEMSYKV